MGSVKDLQVIKKPSGNSLGVGRFSFSDRYSVFDWGEMPDHIPNKGAAIAILGAYFFERLEAAGIPTHYLGLVEDGEAKRLAEVKKPANTMEIKLLEVVKPVLRGGRYDYSAYKNTKGVFLIPLEVIYRNYLPPGSSVFKRLEKGEVTTEELGLKGKPVPNQKLDPPVLDVSTKLEVTDRYFKWQEAQELSGLSDREMNDLKQLAAKVNRLITDEFSKIGLVNEDGKMEFGFDQDRRLVLVDVLGTLDECRFKEEGIPVSKEIARVYYRNTEWFKAVEEAKKKDRQHWKKVCRMDPEPLPPKLKRCISQIYCACTNGVTERDWFKNTPPLKDILAQVKEILDASAKNAPKNIAAGSR